MYKKPIPNANNSKKNTKIGLKPSVNPVDKKSESNNHFKDKDEQLHSMVK